MWQIIVIGSLILLRQISGEPCTDSELFQCHNEKCINDFMVCDNVEDCGDGSDERESICKVVERTQQSGICGKGGHHFSCMGAPCLPLYRVCDATSDCIYGTDEHVCGRDRYPKSAPQGGSGGSGGSGGNPHHTTIKSITVSPTSSTITAIKRVTVNPTSSTITGGGSTLPSNPSFSPPTLTSVTETIQAIASSTPTVNGPVDTESTTVTVAVVVTFALLLIPVFSIMIVVIIFLVYHYLYKRTAKDLNRIELQNQ